MAVAFDAARTIIQNAKCPLVITGAGISAASGVPTGRVNHAATSFFAWHTSKNFAENPSRTWQLHMELRRSLCDIRPNIAHEALTRWARRAPHILVTQNVDGLHEASGHPKTVAVHGSLWKNRCSACGRIREDRNAGRPGRPYSPCCGALERPDIVWIGDHVDEALHSYATKAASLCDVILTIGTSGTVSTVARLFRIVEQTGAKIIEINPDPTGAIPANITLTSVAEDILPDLLAIP